MSKNIMTESKNSELLGQTLRRAGLISFSQIQVALSDQEYNQNLLIGEILALRGWIEQQTADFFADEWQPLTDRLEKYPLGYYLVKSGLLTGEQAYLILEEQKQLWIKFGSIAIIKGLITQDTLNFFLDSIFPGVSSDPPAMGAKSTQQEPEKTEPDSPATEEIDYDDIPWID
mgnify:CR=1 FL=1